MVHTPLTRGEMAAAFVAGWVATYGPNQLPRPAAELLLALLFVENGNGQSINAHNWGNLSTTPQAGGDYWRPPWYDEAKIASIQDPAQRERMMVLHRRMLAHNAPEAFSAFASHEVGAGRFARLLSADRYVPLLAAAAAGDAERFAQAVFSSGYCNDQACRNAGPTYGRIAQEIRAAGLLGSVAPTRAISRAASTALPLVLSLAIGGALLAWRYSKAKA